jgi:hypothetical protein
MIRVALAGLLYFSVALAGPPAQAGAKIISVKATAGKVAAKYDRRPYRRHRLGAVALAVPRCGLVRRSRNGVHWRGLVCPRIAWAGSAPRQPWSYAVFRHKARWEQRSALWQSHIAAGPTHPTIHWGY